MLVKWFPFDLILGRPRGVGKECRGCYLGIGSSVSQSALPGANNVASVHRGSCSRGVEDFCGRSVQVLLSQPGLAWHQGLSLIDKVGG